MFKAHARKANADLGMGYKYKIRSLSLKGLVIGPKISIATKADYLIDFLQKQDGNVDQF